MEPNTLKSKTISGLLWKFAERIGAQAITFILSIILARLLTPSDYGAIAILLIFITFADVFVNAGFGSALIYKKGADNLDFSSVFYFNFIFSVFVYAVIYLAAPYITSFYNIPILQPTLRVLALRIPVAAINSVQQAYVSRNMQFKKFFYSTLSGTAVSAVVGIIMAYNGYGVWSLVGQYLSNAIINTLVLFSVISWRPQLMFSFQRLRSLFNYGWKLLFSSLLDNGYQSLNSLLIGKFYTPTDLAFFDTGQKFPMVIVNNINSSISSVLFPALASEQDKPERVKAHTRKAIQISSYIMWPVMLGMAVCADNIISLVLTNKWLPAVPYLQIACITYGLWPIHTANLQAINAMGRSDIFLKLEIIKKVISITVLLISIQYGVMAVALSGIFIGVISTFINAYPNGYLLKYTYSEQIRDILPSFLCASVMALAVYFSDKFVDYIYFKLMIQVGVGILIYVIISKIFNLDSFEYLVVLLKQKILKRC
ncbi:polysaccharide biosynthesis protein [Phascolarctobacterium sp. CAG:266]|nr:polysaccharide biosynthesis protein [Phascolarctobacterium sp. CAG:266]